jgi:hypothetical protein
VCYDLVLRSLYIVEPHRCILSFWPPNPSRHPSQLPSRHKLLWSSPTKLWARGHHTAAMRPRPGAGEPMNHAPNAAEGRARNPIIVCPPLSSPQAEVSENEFPSSLWHRRTKPHRKPWLVANARASPATPSTAPPRSLSAPLLSLVGCPRLSVAGLTTQIRT